MGRKGAPHDESSSDPECRLVLRVVLGRRRLLGPGRAELLEQIDRTGSISAAARRMKMSYRRAWLHLHELGELLGAPVVETAQGGRQGGGALLSERGRTLLHLYRRMQRAAERAVAGDLARIERTARARGGGAGLSRL